MHGKSPSPFPVLIFSFIIVYLWASPDLLSVDPTGGSHGLLWLTIESGVPMSKAQIPVLCNISALITASEMGVRVLGRVSLWYESCL